MSKLVIFILKRVLICYIVLSIFDIVFIGNRWYALAGLTVGAVFGILRLNSTAALLERLLPSGMPSTAVRTSLIRFVLTLLGLVAIMAASISVNIWIFAGVAAGVLLIPMVVIINGLTEGIGLTHNHWSQDA